MASLEETVLILRSLLVSWFPSNQRSSSSEDHNHSPGSESSPQLERQPLISNGEDWNGLELETNESPDGAWAKIAKRFEARFGPLPRHIRDHAHRILGWMNENPRDSVVIGVGVTGFILMCCTPLILGAVGFGAIGPVAGSIAAGWQSAHGATIAFSILQSAAMGGYGVSILAAVGATTATAYLGSVALFKWHKFMTFIENGRHALAAVQHMAITRKP